MSVDAVTVSSTFFQPIRVTEDILEGLIRTAAPALFPGYDYFDFRPAIRSGAGTRHPDGVLLAEDDWWVVEIESHLHSVSEHIEPQLRELAGGFYGPDEFSFLKRHRTFDATKYGVDVFEPAFILVIDTLTPEVRDAAARTGFEVLECSPFRSDENQWALTVSGFRPRRDVVAPGPGLDLRLGEEDGLAVLYPLDGRKVPSLRSQDIIVADTVHTSYMRRDRRGIVLSLTGEEVRDLLEGADHYRLTSSGRLFAMTSATIRSS